MVYKAKENSQSRSMTSDLKSQLSKARLGSVPRVSMKDRVQEKHMFPEVRKPGKDAETEFKKCVAVRRRCITNYYSSFTTRQFKFCKEVSKTFR